MAPTLHFLYPLVLLTIHLCLWGSSVLLSKAGHCVSGTFGALMLLCTLQTSPRAAPGAALLAPRSFCCTRQGRGSKEALPNGAGVSRVGLGLSGWAGAAPELQPCPGSGLSGHWPAWARWQLQLLQCHPALAHSCLWNLAHRGAAPHLLWGTGQGWTRTSHLNFTRCLDGILMDLGLGVTN